MSRALVSHIEIAAGLLLVPGQQCMNPVLRDGLEEPVWSTQSAVSCAHAWPCHTSTQTGARAWSPRTDPASLASAQTVEAKTVSESFWCRQGRGKHGDRFRLEQEPAVAQ